MVKIPRAEADSSPHAVASCSPTRPPVLAPSPLQAPGPWPQLKRAAMPSDAAQAPAAPAAATGVAGVAAFAKRVGASAGRKSARAAGKLGSLFQRPAKPPPPAAMEMQSYSGGAGSHRKSNSSSSTGTDTGASSDQPL